MGFGGGDCGERLVQGYWRIVDCRGVRIGGDREWNTVAQKTVPMSNHFKIFTMASHVD